MDPTSSRSWQLFLEELRKQGIEFDMVQHADESSRSVLIQSLSSALSPVDRAVVSSTWTRLSSPGLLETSQQQSCSEKTKEEKAVKEMKRNTNANDDDENHPEILSQQQREIILSGLRRYFISFASRNDSEEEFPGISYYYTPFSIADRFFHRMPFYVELKRTAVGKNEIVVEYPQPLLFSSRTVVSS